MKSSFENVYESALKLLIPMNVSKTHKVIVEEAMKLLDGEMGTLFMMQGGKLQRVYTTNPKLLPISPRKHGFTYSVYKTKKPLVLSFKEIYKFHPQIASINMKYDLMVPFVNRGKSFGVMSIMSRKKKFRKKDLDLLNFFTPLASLAIRKAQLYAELDSAVKTRDLFISMATHELRTPVTTMYVYAQLLRNKAKRGEKFNIDWINNLIYEMARLTKLIDEMLQVSQIKTGRLTYEFEEVDLNQIIKRSLKSFKASHKNSNVIYNNDSKKAVSLIADRNKLEQVIINLLDNSAKHNQWKKPIYIRLRKYNSTAEITVEDHGSGMGKEAVSKAFEEYYKEPGHTKAGMGLGLFLIKKIVDGHKGKITIESSIGKGTKVTVKLPNLKYAT